MTRSFGLASFAGLLFFSGLVLPDRHLDDIVPNDNRSPAGVMRRDTLELERVYVSEAGLPLLAGEENIEVASSPEPLRFDGDGNLISPFE